jgi:hypothetical protein
VDKGLYGLKYSAARFHEYLAAKLRKMGFRPSRTDMDLWYRKMGDYYEYIPSSMLKKKHNAIAYHHVHECVAAKIIHFVPVDSILNLADCLTKPLGAVAFLRVVKPLLFREIA